MMLSKQRLNDYWMAVPMTRSSIFRLFAWIVACIATISSLMFSELLGYVPCELCWYQRILMYPLVIISGIGFYKADKTMPFYTLPLSVSGTVLAFVHYLHQKTDLFGKVIQCQQGVPCSSQYINWFGFITIPFLAFVAFLLITVFTILSKQTDQQSS